MADAAQIALAFLAHIGDENDVARGLHLAGIHGTHKGKQRCHRYRGVPDARRVQCIAFAAHLDRNIGREHRVEVGGNQQRLGRTVLAWPGADHVADRIDMDILQPQRRELLLHALGAGGFLERRCGDLGEFDHLGDRLVVIGGDLGMRCH